MQPWVIIVLNMFIGGNVLAATTAAKLETAAGEVWVTASGKTEAKAQTGVQLESGTRIRTGASGKAELVFDDGSRLTMRPSSSLVLSSNKRQKKKNSVVLFFGRVWSKVNRISGGGTGFEIDTPNAVCGVRGTEFETAVADDGSVRVRVTSGKVAVASDAQEEVVDPGEEVSGDEEGMNAAAKAAEQAKWAAWEKDKRERLQKNGRKIIDKVKAKVLSRKEGIEALRAQQEAIEKKRQAAEGRARGGDSAAIDEIRGLNQELAEIADQIADLGDVTDAQFGLVDHFADLASDSRFKMIDRKYLEAEAQSLRRVKATLDKLVKEGTDISIEAMDKMLKEMGSGKTGTLKDKESAADDLFGPDDMNMGPKKPKR